MLVKGHNQLNISIFLLVVSLEIFFNVNYSPTILDINQLPINSNILYYIFAFFFFSAGSHFPDLDLNLKHFYGNKPQFFYHRTFLTHSLLTHLGLLFISISTPFPEINKEYYAILFYFEIGVLTHLLGDIITGSIPLLGQKYVKNEFKISRFLIMPALNNIIYKLFMSHSIFIKYFVSPIYLALFIIVNIIDAPIIILSVLFEQKFSRIGANIVNPKKFETFWAYFEPWIFAFVCVFLLKVSLFQSFLIDFSIAVGFFIFLVSFKVKVLGFSFSYSNFIKTFEKDFNKSFFIFFLLSSAVVYTYILN